MPDVEIHTDGSNPSRSAIPSPTNRSISRVGNSAENSDTYAARVPTTPLHLGPALLIDDRRMLAGKGLVLVDRLSAIERILQHQIQRPARKPLAAIRTAVGRPASHAHDAARHRE